MRNIFCSLFIFSLCSLLLVNKSSAQSNGDILLSTGIQFFAGNDEGFSSMNYRGNKSTSTLGFVLTRENKTLYFLGDFSYGVLANTAGATINELGVNYSHFTFYHRNKANDQGLFGDGPIKILSILEGIIISVIITSVMIILAH